MITTYILPAFFAQALLNGDYAQLSQLELQALKDFNDRCTPGECVEVGEEEFFTHSHAMINSIGGCVCAEFKYLT